MEGINRKYFLFLIILILILSIIFQQIGKHFKISYFLTIPICLIVFFIIIYLVRNKFQ